MTRIALLADIHGNLPALEAAIDDMQQFAPEHVVVAGDLINWGPFSADVLQIVTEKRWTLIRGNSAYYMINAKPPRRPAHWQHYTLIPWLYDQLTDWRHWLAGLPDDLLLLYPDAPDVHLTHGIPGDCWTGIYSAEHDSDEKVHGWLSGTARAKTLFCGHTHIPLNRRVGDYHIINPGSVGVPLLGDRVGSYMILDGTADGWQITAHRQLPLDPAPLFPAWEKQQFVERCGAAAVMVIEEMKQARILVHAFNQWMRDQHPDDQPTLHHAEDFLLIDLNPYMSAPYRAYQTICTLQTT